ncbi:Hypothetical protein (plasmid) [Pseudomonas putida]|nr:Hypothetical protein [Pseudomonas putida]
MGFTWCTFAGRRKGLVSKGLESGRQRRMAGHWRKTFILAPGQSFFLKVPQKILTLARFLDFLFTDCRPGRM